MKFRKKPVEVEAVRWDGTIGGMMEIKRFTDGKTKMRGNGNLAIETLEGTMEASPGDWIIKGIKGEFYPCKPDIFAKTYERVGMQHIESKECWCSPVMYYKDEETGVECWSHNEAGKQ